MQNTSVYPDHLSALSRALLCFFPTTFLETAVYEVKSTFPRHFRPPFLSIASVVLFWLFHSFHVFFFGRSAASLISVVPFCSFSKQT